MLKWFCWLGIHSWNNPVRVSHGFKSSVYDVKKKCSRCGKVKRWVESK
ncbi:hypothetical protein KO361_06210 [Candidatus Woesearchaeota archaeon]|nr:hypothetical protein [Candidatus Woesearchaeota archaeon]